MEKTRKRALAYRNYVPEQDGYLCCACVEQDQKQLDYPHLFFCMVKPEKVDEKLRCAWCGYSVGGHEASCAANRIATMIAGKKETQKAIKEV